MASSLSKEKRARRYLQASMSAGATGLRAEHREAYESQMRSHERAYPGVRRHAIAGSRRHFDEPLLAGERSHQQHLRRSEGLQESDLMGIQRELDERPSTGSRRQAKQRSAAGAAAGSAAGAIGSAAGGGGSTLMYFIGITLGLSLIYLLVSGKGVGALTGVVGALTGGVRAFVAPVDPIAAAEGALGASPISRAPSTSPAPAASPQAAAPGAGGGFLKSLFPGAKYSVSRTDAGKDFSGISGNIGAVAPGKIVSVRNYSGFGTTIFEKLATPIAGKSYAYYALETGGRRIPRTGIVAAGTPLARGTGGVIEVGLSSSADVSGIEQTSAAGHLTPSGSAFAKALGF